MSKASLKKELASFTKEQLVELALNVYSSSKEAKEYFEFFLNPDIDKLIDDKMKLIEKELRKSKWGYSKARISYIKNIVKGVEAYGVGVENAARMMWIACQMLMMEYRFVDYTSTLYNGTLNLLRDYILYCNKNGMLTPAIRNIRTFVERKEVSTDDMRNAASRMMENTLDDIKNS